MHEPGRVRIGLSPRILRQPPPPLGFKGKVLQYLEQSMAHWIMARGGLVFMVPAIAQGSVVRQTDFDIEDYVAELDGLVLQGGADIHPGAYGEEPLRNEWHGDAIRDFFELELVRGFVHVGKPVLGVCRGMQLLNVSYGGTLWQDVPSMVDGALDHRNLEAYDDHYHEVELVDGGGLAAIYPGVRRARVTSIHHQAVKELGDGLSVEAVATTDQVIEAIRHTGSTYVVGVQWHPEFHEQSRLPTLDPGPLLDEFLGAARGRARR